MEQFHPSIAHELRKIVATDTPHTKQAKNGRWKRKRATQEKSVSSASASIWVENWLKTYLWKYAKARAAKVR